jgi:hypothetical protein
MKEISNELSKDSLSADQSMGKHADETSVKDGGRIQKEMKRGLASDLDSSPQIYPCGFSPVLAT